MKKIGGIILCFILASPLSAQEDREGCKDHPMFTRMNNFYIGSCRESQFDQIEFRDEKGRDIKVEGKLNYLEYNIKKGITKPPSSLQIIRNFENAIKKIGGGAGSLTPVASNKTEKGRAKNRRVELVEQ